MRDSSSCSTWLPQTLAVDHRPTPAAEFPNDNPDLHQGARWVCLRTRGASRAVWRWAGEGLTRASLPAPSAALTGSAAATAAPAAAASAAAAPATAESASAGAASVVPAAPLASSPWPPSPFALAPPDPLPEPPPRREPEEPEETLPPVMDLDLGLIVLPQRVADVPPPPAFVYRPFRRTRPEVTLDPERPVSVARMLDVSSFELGRAQVRRGSRVDVAPCIALQSSAPAIGATLVLVDNPVSAQVDEAEPAPRVEPERRRSRRALPVRRGPITSSSGEELEKAILELESAFGERVALAAP